MNKCDFAGWATKNDLRCSDGRTIAKDAFAHCDGTRVPLVWNHQHKELDNILGHAILENRDGGVWAYGFFNDTEEGVRAKQLVSHGDIDSLSIFANRLRQNGSTVVHGDIKEVSLVFAGANPGAHIESVMAHSDDDSIEECVIYTGDYLSHSDEDTEEDDDTDEVDTGCTDEDDTDIKDDKTDDSDDDSSDDFVSHSDDDSSDESDGEKTIEDVLKTLNKEQQDAFFALIGAIVSQIDETENNNSNEEGNDSTMKHNVFENDETKNTDTLSHEAVGAIIGDAKRFGSLKESFMQHAQEYGIEQIDWLFPEAKTLSTTPEIISRKPDGWVQLVMNGVHKVPFSRIKSMFADITEDEARARGYKKGNLKMEEVFGLLKRTTTPTTVYKKQKLDRDDIVDITDFNVVSWLKTEMRGMLDEELARCFLFGDGRNALSEDKIDASCIRPAILDADLYTIKKTVTPASGESLAHALINAAVSAQDDYQGSGNLTAFIDQSKVTDMLLLEDTQGHRIYKTIDELALGMNVNRIVKVPSSILPANHYGIILDLDDYKVGADKGGAINMFDDFDIDYNQEKYLIETRCSGALTKPYSAIALKAS